MVGHEGSAATFSGPGVTTLCIAQSNMNMMLSSRNVFQTRHIIGLEETADQSGRTCGHMEVLEDRDGGWVAIQGR